jgi:hypothetical protein
LAQGADNNFHNLQKGSAGLSMIYPPCQFPNAIPIAVPGFSILRYLKYFRLRKQFDLVLQSDYQPILPLSWIARQNLFVNYLFT